MCPACACYRLSLVMDALPCTQRFASAKSWKRKAEGGRGGGGGVEAAALRGARAETQVGFEQVWRNAAETLKVMVRDSRNS